MQDRIDHAKSYPFPIPDRSYLFRGGQAEPFDPARMKRGERVPVLAAGSNQSPEQLARKYREHGADMTIPAQRGRLVGFDVVYAAKITGYGSVPATFQASPGTAVTVFVLWLDEAQLARMHETEAMYSYDHLTGIEVALDDGAGTLTEAFAYSSLVGCLARDGACVGLAEIPAEGRRFPAASQIEALSHLRDLVAPGHDLDQFIAGHLDDTDERARRAARLRENAVPLDFPRRTLLSF